MGVFTVQMKTHSREVLTKQFEGQLNKCCKHGVLPSVQKVIAGRRKETHYIAVCPIHDDCGKISDSAADVVAAWNKWNRPSTD